MRPSNKTALITGSGRGIGFATAKRFLREGARVAMLDVDDTQGGRAAEELSSEGLVSFYPCNVAYLEQVRETVTAVQEEFAPIDILVNNTGTTKDGFVSKMEEDQWQDVVDINLTGAYHCTRALSPVMIDQCYGTMINASSMVGSKGNMGQVNYSAIKVGIEGMTRSLAKELGPKGITVNAVAPGFVATPMTEQMPQKVREKLTNQIPLNRMGKPEDVANAYAFLASDEAAYSNGVVLPVNGGIEGAQ